MRKKNLRKTKKKTTKNKNNPGSSNAAAPWVKIISQSQAISSRILSYILSISVFKATSTESELLGSVYMTEFIALANSDSEPNIISAVFTSISRYLQYVSSSPPMSENGEIDVPFTAEIHFLQVFIFRVTLESLKHFAVNPCAEIGQLCHLWGIYIFPRRRSVNGLHCGVIVVEVKYTCFYVSHNRLLSGLMPYLNF